MSLGTAAGLDFAKVHRFAPALNAHQWRQFGAGLGSEHTAGTEAFIDYLRTHHLTSNVDLDEVQPVSLSDLRGVDDVVAALETHIALPLEESPLAEKLQLRPKRGVEVLLGGLGLLDVGIGVNHPHEGHPLAPRVTASRASVPSPIPILSCALGKRSVYVCAPGTARTVVTPAASFVTAWPR